jgi:hypothetical protein
MGFDPYNCSLKIRESIGTLTPKVGVHLGVWSSFPHTLPHSQENEMWLPGFLLACTFASPCLGREPKAKVATNTHFLFIFMHNLRARSFAFMISQSRTLGWCWIPLRHNQSLNTSCINDWRYKRRHFSMSSHTMATLQQKVSLYAKWFHWILNEFTSHSDKT